MNENVKNMVLGLCNLDKAYLFGSRAKGNFNDRSDYDICFVISDDNKEVVYQTVVEYMLHNEEIIQPLVMTKPEFAERMKINVYRNEIIGNGKIIAK